MIIDILQQDAPNTSDRYDVCIAGGGVAGIVLAHKLATQKKRVLLLEGGGLDVSEESQELYRGSNVGHPYPDLDATRLRFLGGSSNHWAGWCRPLDAYDFAKQPHINDSGWPIGVAEIEPYLSETLGILGIPDFPPDRVLDGSKERLKEVYFSLGPPVLFAEKYREFLSTSDRVEVLLHANLVEIEMDPSTGAVSAFVYKGYEENARARKATAKAYVLALGGIENARILLSERRRQANFLGRAMDHVGRYFMEHLHYAIGYFVWQSENTIFGKENWFVAPTIQWMRDQGIANARFKLIPDHQPDEISLKNKIKAEVREQLCANDIVNDFLQSIRNFRCRPMFNAGRFSVASEQVPNWNSRVALADNTDRFGINRARLDWQLTAFDNKTIRTGALEVAKYFARQDIYRVKLFNWILDEESELPGQPEVDDGVGNHHMGTTRMGITERDGVVDRNCRVFGTKNLYIAGSSVFRTGGHANPTFTIIQLALRLADHLSSRAM